MGVLRIIFVKILAFLAIVATAEAFQFPATATVMRQARDFTGGMRTSRLGLVRMQESSFEDGSSSIVKGDEATLCDWSFVDEVHLITTTASSEERKQNTQRQLEKVGVWSDVRVSTFVPEDNRVRGCYTSHIKVMRDVQQRMAAKTKENKSKNLQQQQQQQQQDDDYRVLILEDNLEIASRMDPAVVQQAATFLEKVSQPGAAGFDVFHLAYMMYVPGLAVKKTAEASNVVQMFTEEISAVGTSAYIISKRGVETVLAQDEQEGFVDMAIPNVMAKLFPSTRYASYPMIFHRARTVGSLVNPQLDAFRKFVFAPSLVAMWERLMVATGLRNNELLPGVMVVLLGAVGTTAVGSWQQVHSGSASATSLHHSGALGGINPVEMVPQMLLAVPFLAVLWGAKIFASPDGAGFAESAKANQ